MTTTYVFHCDECGVMINKDHRERYVACPKKRRSKPFNGEFPMLGIPDYKRGENYPQRAVNLPGEPVVQSYSEYNKLCKKHGMVETGVSEESRKRSKFYKRKPKDMRLEV